MPLSRLGNMLSLLIASQATECCLDHHVLMQTCHTRKAVSTHSCCVPLIWLCTT